MKPYPEKYFHSLSLELDSQANRVRSLIGSKHWGLDGAHKEALLRGLVERHLPSGAVASRAFLVSCDGAECSREQDLTILDTSVEAPLFSFGGLAVADTRRAMACVSVKSSFQLKELRDSLDTFQSVPREPGVPRPFFGSYHFETATELPNLEETARTAAGWIADARHSDAFVARATDKLLLCYEPGVEGGTLRCYAPAVGATAYFLALLLNHLAALRSNASSTFGNALDSATGDIKVVEASVTF